MLTNTVNIALGRASLQPGRPPAVAADLPPEAPLAMPAQSLAVARTVRPAEFSAPASHCTRAFIGAFVAIATGLGASWLLADLRGEMNASVQIVTAAIFILLFAWTAFSFATACAGFVALARRARPLGLEPGKTRSSLASRTAILAPVFNEDVARVHGRLHAMCEDLCANGRASNFDVFILSDSTDPAIWPKERRGFLQLRGAFEGRCRIYYRRRIDNVARKAGNIAEWVRRFGAAYDFMVVLDADSLMTADTLAALASAMEQRPDVGLIQTAPVLIGRTTLFGRAMQFANRLHAPLMTSGMASFSGAEGNYWGHNAIIRLKAFAACAGLPTLPGRAPFGGSILSHDFVEAALIRRGGWAVHLAPQLGGTYEECPPTLADFLKRDRRWCQGNLQHFGVVGAKGLHWISRLHLINGIFGYAASPLWLAFVILAGLSITHDPTKPGGSASAWTLAIALVFLLKPRLLSYAWAMRNGRLRSAYGGWLRTFAGLVFEICLSALLAPIIMLSHTRVVAALLIGSDGGWGAQRRVEQRTSLGEAISRFGWHTGVGSAVATGSLAIPHATFWLAPLVAGPVLSIPLALLLERPSFAERVRRAGLLTTPEESTPPPIVKRAASLASTYEPHVAATGSAPTTNTRRIA